LGGGKKDIIFNTTQKGEADAMLLLLLMKGAGYYLGEKGGEGGNIN